MVSLFIFSSCKSTGGGSYRDVNYDPATLKTPSGHGLEKKEYPFDDDGRYRKEWVKGNTKGRTKTSYPGQSSTTGTEVASAGTTTAAYPTYAELSSSGGDSTSAAAESESSSSSAAKYHKVTSGDTLFAIAARYNTSVADLKRVNGLSGDSIRVGQSIRIP